MTEHKNLWAALLAFKKEAPALPKDKINPHFKSRYTPLDTIADKIDPLLTKHGLVWAALPSHDNGQPTLDYRLAHAPSGEVLAGSMPLLLDKENSQGLGSALTYARRYTKVAVLDLVADEDDDGHAASQQTASRPASNGLASEKQRRLVFAKAKEAKLEASMLANAMLLAAGSEVKFFETEEDAQAYVDRALPKLPARLVNPVLEKIAEGVGA